MKITVVLVFISLVGMIAFIIAFINGISFCFYFDQFNELEEKENQNEDRDKDFLKHLLECKEKVKKSGSITICCIVIVLVCFIGFLKLYGVF